MFKNISLFSFFFCIRDNENISELLENQIKWQELILLLPTEGNTNPRILRKCFQRIQKEDKKIPRLKKILKYVCL